MDMSAVISPCGVYRYELLRKWSDGDLCNFVMLNPSTADASIDDPTIRRCIGFAQRWGYGQLAVTNLFALRSTNPKNLKGHADPIGPDNDSHLLRIAALAALTVCAWGRNGSLRNRDRTVLRTIFGPTLQIHCLGLNGEPQHPLYIPYERPLKKLEATNDPAQ